MSLSVLLLFYQIVVYFKASLLFWFDLCRGKERCVMNRLCLHL